MNLEFLLNTVPIAAGIVVALWLRDIRHRRANRHLEQRIRDRQDVGLD